MLSDLYRTRCGGDADTERLGYDALINRLKGQGCLLDHDVIVAKMKIISTRRNKAIHGRRETLEIPTKDEANAIIHLTTDVLQKIAARGNSKD